MKPRDQDASRDRRRLNDRGYIMVALLIAMAVAAVWMGAALPAWRQQAMRQKEEELIFRGEQYARAIALYQIKNNSYPLELDQLVDQRFLRKRWLDPVTGKDFQTVGLTAPGQSGPGSFQTNQGGVPGRGGVPGGAPGGMPSGLGTTAPGRGSTGMPGGQPGLTGGITGVRSTSQATSIKIYNGQQQHNLWQFDAALMMARLGRSPVQGGQPGAGRGDGRGGPGREGGPAGPARGGAPGRGAGAPGRGGFAPPPPPPPMPGPGRGAGS